MIAEYVTSKAPLKLSWITTSLKSISVQMKTTNFVVMNVGTNAKAETNLANITDTNKWRKPS